MEVRAAGALEDSVLNAVLLAYRALDLPLEGADVLLGVWSPDREELGHLLFAQSLPGDCSACWASGV